MRYARLFRISTFFYFLVSICHRTLLMTVVSDDRLKTWTRREGRIRLSEDDGPPAREFLEDDYDEDNEELPIGESGARVAPGPPARQLP